jgi:hypothetical protein
MCLLKVLLVRRMLGLSVCVKMCKEVMHIAQRNTLVLDTSRYSQQYRMQMHSIHVRFLFSSSIQRTLCTRYGNTNIEKTYLAMYMPTQCCHKLTVFIWADVPIACVQLR